MRDVYDCCRNFQGLRPRLEVCLLDSTQSQTMRMLVLDGVIPITYRGITYQIPVMIWCRPYYPNEAPVPYVRPTASMVIRERHANVDKEGRVYLQHYLSIWDPSQFSLYGLVVAMIRVFTVEPPVNSRPTPHASGRDEPERRRLITQLSGRLTERLRDSGNDAMVEVEQLQQRGDVVRRSEENASHETSLSQKRFRESEEAVASLARRKGQLEEWLEVWDRADVRDCKDVDVLLRYRDLIDGQIADCMAKDHALTDTLDQVDEAFVKGVIDHDMYMKDVRHLSREQFFPRALRKKLVVAHGRGEQGGMLDGDESRGGLGIGGLRSSGGSGSASGHATVVAQYVS